MQYEMRRPTTETEAIEIIDAAMRVVYGQIEYYRGHRKKAWKGDFVDHCHVEMTHSLAWLADRYPKTAPSVAITVEVAQIGTIASETRDGFQHSYALRSNGDGWLYRGGGGPGRLWSPVAHASEVPERFRDAVSGFMADHPASGN